MQHPLILAVPLAISTTIASPVPVSAQTTDGIEAQVIRPPGGLSETAPEVHAFFETLRVYEMFEILSVEGVVGSSEMEAEMFPGQGGTAWPAVVAGIYAADRLIAEFEAALPMGLITEPVLAELTAFFDTDLGWRIVDGEVSARRAFLEPGVEESAEERAVARARDDDPRIGLLTEFIVANDLIERNVMGALNSNFAFYQGLVDGEAFETEIPEALMLTEIWGQEPEIRSETTNWLYAYQLMAYADLSDAELQAYIDFSNTEAGQVLNQVLFAGFDMVFDSVSRDLGMAAAVLIAGEET